MFWIAWIWSEIVIGRWNNHIYLLRIFSVQDKFAQELIHLLLFRMATNGAVAEFKRFLFIFWNPHLCPSYFIFLVEKIIWIFFYKTKFKKLNYILIFKEFFKVKVLFVIAVKANKGLKPINLHIFLPIEMKWFLNYKYLNMYDLAWIYY